MKINIKKQLLFLLTIVLSFNGYSQISFENGYYIDNNNNKINCLIKNIDWRYNPTKLEYKHSENSESKKITIKSIKEFGIDNISKYVRSTVNIDRSSEVVSNLSNVKNPIFQEEVLFLKVLVEGKGTLYHYIDGNSNKFFFKKGNSNIEQLIFKTYRTTEKNLIGENNRFKQQIWNNLKCANINISEIKSLKYKKKDFIRFFISYNECNNQEYVNFEEKQKRDLFNLSLRPGLNNSTLIIDNIVSNSKDADFGSELAFRFGVEAEFIMPFHRNKWALIVEPTYQYFKKGIELTSHNVEVDYSSIEIPIGIRHYLFLNDNSKLFINGSIIFDLSNKSKINFDPGTDLEIKTLDNLAFGLGFKHNDKYSIELRYQTPRNILNYYSFWSSKYKTFSIIFGYSLF